MANCKYCQKWVGLFKSVHAECEEAHERAEAERLAHEKEVEGKVEEACAALISLPLKGAQDAEIAALLDPITGGQREILWRAVTAWFKHLVVEMGSDGASQAQVEQAVGAVLGHYGLKADDLPGNLWGRFVRICTCLDLERGELPARVQIEGNLPFNLESGEVVVWVFKGVDYLEDKTVRSSTRGYAGLSVRVVPGVYAHTGQSAPMNTVQGFFPIDKGIVALTDRALLFSGAHKALRVKYKDIASFTRYDFGFAICKGTQTARNQGFEVPDVLAAFPFMVLQGLARLNAASIAKGKK